MPNDDKIVQPTNIRNLKNAIFGGEMNANAVMEMSRLRNIPMPNRQMVFICLSQMANCSFSIGRERGGKPLIL
jgi:hypothetical protein